MEDKVKVSLVIQSHINDATIEMIHNPELAYEHLHFVQYLIHFYPDTTQEILVDWVYEQFKKFSNK